MHTSYTYYINCYSTCNTKSSRRTYIYHTIIANSYHITGYMLCGTLYSSFGIIFGSGFGFSTREKTVLRQTIYRNDYYYTISIVYKGNTYILYILQSKSHFFFYKKNSLTNIRYVINLNDVFYLYWLSDRQQWHRRGTTKLLWECYHAIGIFIGMAGMHSMSMPLSHRRSIILKLIEMLV
jgi:hypothetical protein